jgi:hypothetical protein
MPRTSGFRNYDAEPKEPPLHCLQSLDDSSYRLALRDRSEATNPPRPGVRIGNAAANGGCGRAARELTPALAARPACRTASPIVAGTTLECRFGTRLVNSLGHSRDGCQRTTNEGCPHQPERLAPRDAAAGKTSSQFVEGVFCGVVFGSHAAILSLRLHKHTATLAG